VNALTLACSCGAPCALGATSCGGCQTDLGSPPDVRSGVGPADTGRSYPVGRVLGSYRLLQQIGSGGMGRVFVAEHVRLGRRVALKVLRSEFSGNLEAVKRFFAEARSVNCISHENIIEVSDFVESARGPSFYIMELLRGIGLHDLQRREGVLPLARALPIALQVCSALGAAHQAGIIHRDLKPDNIFLIERAGRRDFVKLLDFGVAKLMNATVDDASAYRSSAGMVVGTPNYMAPEQAMGHAANHLVDVYAMGVILFEMVAGRRPFVGTTAREVMVQHLTVPPASPSKLNPAHAIPAALEELILACLRKEPGERPGTIQQVEQRLRAILEALPVDAPPSVPARPRARRRKPLGLVAGAALLIAVAAGVFGARDLGLLSSAKLLAAEARSTVGGVAERVAPSSFQTRPQAPSQTRPRTLIQADFTVIPAAPAPAVPPVAAAAAVPPVTAVAAVPPVPARAAEEPARPLKISSEKSVRRATSLPPVDAEPPPTSEHRHVKLDRGAVLNPFE